MLTKVFLYAACTTLLVKAMFTNVVEISDEVFDTYKKQRDGYEYGLVRYKITGSRPPTAVVESTGDAKWQDFVDGLSNHEPRFATYDFGVTIGDQIRKGIVFVVWIPDSAGLKQKVMYASAKNNLRAKFNHITYDVEADSKTDLDYSVIYDEVERRLQ